MAKITLTDVTNLQNEQTAVSRLAANNDAIEAAFENTLSRDGTSPNQMAASLDMNSHRILNLPVPMTDAEPLRLQDLADFTNGGVTFSPMPTGGLEGALLVKASGTDYDTEWTSDPTFDSATIDGDLYVNYLHAAGAVDVVGATNLYSDLIINGAAYSARLNFHNTAGPGYNKYIRLGATSELEIVNSANTNVIMTLTDTGALAVTGAVSTTDTTASTSTTTGALKVTGGAGIAGDLYASGLHANANIWSHITATTGAYHFGTSGSKYLDYNGTLFTLGGGVLSITDSTAATSTTTGALQVAGGASIVGKLYTGGAISISSTTASTSTTTGALIVSGGAGIAGNVYAGGALNVASTTASSSTTTGAIVTAGGLGVAGNIFAGFIQSNGNVAVGGDITGFGDLTWTGAAWTTYTPTVTVSGGGAGTATGRYKRLGKTVAVQINVTITTGGTISAATLPAGMSATADFYLVGRENASTGAMWMGACNGSSIGLKKYDASVAVTAGWIIALSGTVEIA